MNPNISKTCIILRGVSNVGKSTFADTLAYFADDHYDVRICTADDYMTDDFGNYSFNAQKLPFAHLSCQRDFKRAIEDLANLIIVANTNTKEADFAFYLDLAQLSGYIVHVVTLEKYHNNKNGHDVPKETLARQEKNILKSLKLQ